MDPGVHAEQDCGFAGPHIHSLLGGRPGGWNDRTGHLVCGFCGLLCFHLPAV